MVHVDHYRAVTSRSLDLNRTSVQFLVPIMLDRPGAREDPERSLSSQPSRGPRLPAHDDDRVFGLGLAAGCQLAAAVRLS